MTKMFTTLSIVASILSSAGIALADGPAAGPNVSLPAGVQECVDKCTAAAGCCEKVEALKTAQEKMQSELDKINKRLNPTHKAGYKPVDRVKALGERLEQLIKDGDKASVAQAKKDLEQAMKDVVTHKELEDAIAGLQGQINALTIIVNGHTTKIDNHETRITQLEEKADKEYVAAFLKAGGLLADSKHFTYKAITLGGGLDLPVIEGLLGVVLDASATLSSDGDGDGSDTGFNSEAYARVAVLPWLDVHGGAYYGAAGADSLRRAEITTLGGLVGVGVEPIKHIIGTAHLIGGTAAYRGGYNDSFLGLTVDVGYHF